MLVVTLTYLATTDPIDLPVDPICSRSDRHMVFAVGWSSVSVAVWHVVGS